MKRLILTFTFLCAFLVLTPTLSAFAAESEPSPKNVTITVVMPDATPEPSVEPTPVLPSEVKLYPVDVAESFEGSRRQIIKTYELSPLDSPADIPRSDFERNGWTYSLTDIVKRETANAETRDHTETVTLNTDTKELEKILTLLAPTLEYKAEDDFVGILSLDVASIKVETAGTKTSTYEMKVTREYPHLSTNDTSLVPKSVTDNGKTYNLAGVDWKVGNYSTVDYEQIPDYYTAVATYTATGSSTKVTGYVTTAEYVGTLAKLSQGKTVYTAYFEGTEIRTPLEMAELPSDEATVTPSPSEAPAEEKEADDPPTAEPTEQPTDIPSVGTPSEPDVSGDNPNTALYVIIALLSLLVMCSAFYIIKNGKGQTHNEKATHTPSGTHDDDGDGGTRTGG